MWKIQKQEVVCGLVKLTRNMSQKDEYCVILSLKQLHRVAVLLIMRQSDIFTGCCDTYTCLQPAQAQAHQF